MPAGITDTPATLTIICAHDNLEAEMVRRDLGLPPHQVVKVANADDVTVRLAGLHGGCILRIVETPRFLQRPDAGEIRQAVHMASLGSTVERVNHNGEGEPIPYLLGGTRTRLNGSDAVTNTSGSPEQALTREQLADLLDSSRPASEIADTIIRSMHMGFGDHPVVREILARREAVYKAYVPGGQGETAEQIISEEKAHALAAHISQAADDLAARHAAAGLPSPIQVPPLLGPVKPGAHLVTVYGVRIIVAPDKAPVLAEQRGNAGHATLGDIIRHAVPAGTQPHEAHRMLVPTADDDEPMRQHIEQETRRSFAHMIGEPHVLIYLTQDDLPRLLPSDAMHSALVRGGMMLVIGVTVRAIPGALDHIVLRPAPGAPPLPHPYNGRWSARPKHTSGDGIMLAEVTAMGAHLMTAHATGRIEVNGDGAIAEVFEVNP